MNSDITLYILYKDFLLLVKNQQSRFIADTFKTYLQSNLVSQYQDHALDQIQGNTGRKQNYSRIK